MCGSALEAEADPLVALELLQAECRALTRQAVTAGIEQGESKPLTNRIDDLLRLADIVPLDTLLGVIDALYADVVDLRGDVVDTMNQVQTLRLSGLAATSGPGADGLPHRRSKCS